MTARPSTAEIISAIDQTLLKPTVGFAEGARWIEEMRGFGFATLCVSPFLVPVASQHLAGTTTRVCSVAGFPLGYSMTESKAEEAAHLVALGAHEVDVVVNIAALIEGEDDFVLDDLRVVCDTVRDRSEGTAIVKVILETGYLADERIVRGCELAVAAGAAFVKTSTGFGPRGASVHDVELMHHSVPATVGVKAAGGIRDLETVLAMLAAGATRIGTSAGAEIVSACTGPAEYPGS